MEDWFKKWTHAWVAVRGGRGEIPCGAGGPSTSSESPRVQFDEATWGVVDRALRRYVTDLTRTHKWYPEAPRYVRASDYYEKPGCVFLDRKCLSTRGLKWGTHRLSVPNGDMDRTRAVSEMQDDDTEPRRTYAFLEYLFGSPYQQKSREFPPINPTPIDPDTLEKYARITEQQLTGQEARVIQKYDDFLNTQNTEQEASGEPKRLIFETTYNEFLDRGNNNELTRRMRAALQYFHNAHYRAKQKDDDMKRKVLGYIKDYTDKYEVEENSVMAKFKVKYMLEKFQGFQLMDRHCCGV